MEESVTVPATVPQAPFVVGQKVTPDRARVPRSVTSQNLVEHFCGQVYPGTVVTIAELHYSDGKWALAFEEHPGYYFQPGFFVLAHETPVLAE